MDAGSDLEIGRQAPSSGEGLEVFQGCIALLAKECLGNPQRELENNSLIQDYNPVIDK